MDKYEIIFTVNAIKKLDQIYAYISENLYSVKAANDLINKIESSIMNLESFPFIGLVVSDSTLSYKNYRKLVIKNYIVLYTIQDLTVVNIMDIRYGGSDYLKLL